MKFKALVFDKDGTLLDYSALWVPQTKEAARLVCEHYGAPFEIIEKYLEKTGLGADVADIRGAMPRGAHQELRDIMHGLLESYGIKTDIEEMGAVLGEAYNKAAPLGRAEPICENLKAILADLRREGYILALITSDGIVGAKNSIARLGVVDLFDEFIAHDGTHPPKPNPYYMDTFREKYNLKKEDVLMIGDTETDIAFAKNSGVRSVGVGKTEANRSYLSHLGADAVIYSVEDLPSYLNDNIR